MNAAAAQAQELIKINKTAAGMPKKDMLQISFISLYDLAIHPVTGALCMVREVYALLLSCLRLAVLLPWVPLLGASVCMSSVPRYCLSWAEHRPEKQHSQALQHR